MGIQGEFFETPEPRVPEIVDEPITAPMEASDLIDVAASSGPEALGSIDVTAPSEAPSHVRAHSVANSAPQTKASPVKRGLKDLSIPKLYYSISEVSRLTGLEPYVLRYWETEFDELNPQKNRAGNRIYSNKDIKFILRIKELLREQRYTIEGAKHILRDERVAERERPAPLEATGPDPDQIVLPTEPKTAPKLSISLGEIQEMKHTLATLRGILAQSR